MLVKRKQRPHAGVPLPKIYCRYIKSCQHFVQYKITPVCGLCFLFTQKCANNVTFIVSKQQ